MRPIPLLLLPVILLAQTDWRDKPVDQWSAPDAEAIIASSAWVKTVTPSRVAVLPAKPASPIRGLWRPHKSPAAAPATAATPATLPVLPTLTLRWESALPLREARRKLGGPAPIDGLEDHYVIAVYGIPSALLTERSKELDAELKEHATLKMYAKKDRQPSSVQILERKDGPVVLFFFPKTDEITWRDHRIQFDAEIANLRISQAFDTFDMRFHNKLEL